MTHVWNIVPGSRWQHWKGTIYKIVAVGRLESDPEEFMVCYQNEVDESVWVRPISSFLEEADTRGYGDHRAMRFSLIPE